MSQAAPKTIQWTFIAKSGSFDLADESCANQESYIAKFER
jgi:hypothetical protein